MIDRSSFADFLDRLADGRISSLEWERFIVQHYADTVLEEVQRWTVRLMQNCLPYHGNTEPGREALRCWAMAIRSDSSNESTEGVTLSVTQEEAVVLDEILRRFSMTGQLAIEHPAEQQVLWNLGCVMEKHVDRPLWPSLEVSRCELSQRND